ncbi:MAG: HupE/UreJ family protein [Gammaproteobacteria bacterium]|nr:HupE/UreJ family protein [Gammaproteobacteria bacterium]
MRMPLAGWRRLLLLPWLLLAACATAHEARPLVVTIDGFGSTIVYRVEIRMPDSIGADNRPYLRLPGDCMYDGPTESVAQTNVAVVRCEQPLEGRPLAVNFPAFNPNITTLIRYTPAGGVVRVGVLPPEQPTWTIPVEPGVADVAWEYLRLGATHIWGGLDHLLFVAGLLLLARGRQQLVLAITGFTIGHSITLSLAALDIVRIPAAPTEAAIALSIVFLAREVVINDRCSLAHRYPLLIAATFGLLHGLGFASALRETGLPDEYIVQSLLCFNVGVELGQLAFVMGIVLLMTAARAVNAGFSHPARSRTCACVSAYAIGIPAAYWFLGRLPGIFGP